MDSARKKSSSGRRFLGVFRNRTSTQDPTLEDNLQAHHDILDELRKLQRFLVEQQQNTPLEVHVCSNCSGSPGFGASPEQAEELSAAAVIPADIDRRYDQRIVHYQSIGLQTDLKEDSVMQIGGEDRKALYTCCSTSTQTEWDDSNVSQGTIPKAIINVSSSSTQTDSISVEEEKMAYDLPESQTIRILPLRQAYELNPVSTSPARQDSQMSIPKGQEESVAENQSSIGLETPPVSRQGSLEPLRSLADAPNQLYETVIAVQPPESPCEQQEQLASQAAEQILEPMPASESVVSTVSELPDGTEETVLQEVQHEPPVNAKSTIAPGKKIMIPWKGKKITVRLPDPSYAAKFTLEPDSAPEIEIPRSTAAEWRPAPKLEKTSKAPARQPSGNGSISGAPLSSSPTDAGPQDLGTGVFVFRGAAPGVLGRKQSRSSSKIEVQLSALERFFQAQAERLGDELAQFKAATAAKQKPTRRRTASRAGTMDRSRSKEEDDDEWEDVPF